MLDSLTLLSSVRSQFARLPFATWQDPHIVSAHVLIEFQNDVLCLLLIVSIILTNLPHYLAKILRISLSVISDRSITYLTCVVPTAGGFLSKSNDSFLFSHPFGKEMVELLQI